MLYWDMLNLTGVFKNELPLIVSKALLSEVGDEGLKLGNKQLKI